MNEDQVQKQEANFYSATNIKPNHRSFGERSMCKHHDIATKKRCLKWAESFGLCHYHYSMYKKAGIECG
jgi:hypothetical protein